MRAVLLNTHHLNRATFMSQAVTTKNIEQILRLELPVIVRLGERSMCVSEVTALAPGAIIQLTKKADCELDLLINNKRIGYGHAVKVGENFGIRLTYVGDVRQRIEALGPDGQGVPGPDAA